MSSADKKVFFITGTGTGVGKTLVTAGLAMLSHRLGFKTLVMKPVQTGTAEGLDDLSFVRKIAPEVSTMPPFYSFPFPASPHLSAKFAKRVINPKKLAESIRWTSDFGLCDVLLVEGAGGLMVPLRGDYMMIDMMRELGAPVILVATTGLGTINHTLLSLEAMRSRKMKVAGIVFNMLPRNPDAIHKDNIETIKKLGKVPVLGVLNEIAPLREAENISNMDEKTLSEIRKAVSFNADVIVGG